VTVLLAKYEFRYATPAVANPLWKLEKDAGKASYTPELGLYKLNKTIL
jgi:hypothetical protein